jgi:Flp pilus assembly protein TadG
VWFAILTFAFIVLLGLTLDGGAKIRALQRADNIATEAARAAGQAINAPQAIIGGTKQIDPDLAIAAAQAYITTAGATCPAAGCVQIAPDLQHITVTVQVTYQPVVLGLIGVDRWTVTGTTTATLVVGT